MLAIAAIVIIALLSSGSSAQVEPVDSDDVQQQIDGLRNLIERTPATFSRLASPA